MDNAFVQIADWQRAQRIVNGWEASGCTGSWRNSPVSTARSSATSPAVTTGVRTNANMPGPRPLTRDQGLQVAAVVIRSLQGYRKNPDYRTMQNDLSFVCEVLQCASAGETLQIARLRESHGSGEDGRPPFGTHEK
jgi:hypothetical protein